MLTGLLSTSEGKCQGYQVCVSVVLTGDASFYGVSVKDNLDVVRSMLGVCPQVGPRRVAVM